MINWDSAFGKNDIRGIYGKDVTEELFFFTSKAYIKYIMEQTGKQAKDIWVTVCMDARTHSPQLKDIIVKGVTSAGANIILLSLSAVRADSPKTTRALTRIYQKEKKSRIL